MNSLESGRKTYVTRAWLVRDVKVRYHGRKCEGTLVWDKGTEVRVVWEPGWTTYIIRWGYDSIEVLASEIRDYVSSKFVPKAPSKYTAREVTEEELRNGHR